jgi:replicative superfamily II helicase
MPRVRTDEKELDALRGKLRFLGNRYAIEILQVLSPEKGDIIQNMGWDEIVEGIMSQMGYEKPKARTRGERSAEEVRYTKLRKRFAAGGTLYESMNKLVKAGYVHALGGKGKKQRTFMITHEGRLALSAIDSMIGPTSRNSELYRTAKLLLRHKNYTRLLPTQEKFLDEIGSIDENIIIQMPPGSGKTFLAMVAVLIKLQNKKKCLYLSPYLSLNTQVINEYGKLLEELGYSVVRHDGTKQVSSDELENADIIIAVYESVFSDVLESEKWTSKIELAIIDELTELDSPIEEESAANIGTDRSPRLDLLITLLRKKSQIITLSSRFGDTEAVSRWLSAKVFRPSVRLNPDEFIVTKHDDGIHIASSDGTQSVTMKREYALESIIEHLGDHTEKSILIVASSRSQAVFVAGVISRHWPREVDPSIADYVVGQERDLPVAGQLYGCLRTGVAFHHAGLSSEVRQRLEEKIKSATIRTVVSTTGITAGISFPFDCVIILYDRAMGFLAARSRYLQIAGRIGEYHLAEHGGSVYLVFEFPSRRFQTAEELVDRLLHRPLEALRPGPIYPSIMANLMAREIINHREFDDQQLARDMIDILSETFRAVQDKGYPEYIREMNSNLFAWMLQKESFERVGHGFRLAEDIAAAARSGLDIIRFLEIKEKLNSLGPDASDTDLAEIVLSFGPAQIVRPRTSYPTRAELSAAGLKAPDSWYDALTAGRNIVKNTTLRKWIGEISTPAVLSEANEEGQNMVINGENIGNVDIEEGDLDSLIGICSSLAMDLNNYYRVLKKSKVAERLRVFSRQLKYGAKADLAATDLLEITITDEYDIPMPISKQDARMLFNNGYLSISDVLRKDIDPQKKSLARDRFAKNSGLSHDYAKKVYKACLSRVRASLAHD